MTETDANHLLTIKEACRRIRCGKTFLYSEVKRGRLKITKRGKPTEKHPDGKNSYVTVGETDRYVASLPKRG